MAYDIINKVRNNSATAQFTLDPNAGCDPLDVEVHESDMSDPNIINKLIDGTDIIDKVVD